MRFRSGGRFVCVLLAGCALVHCSFLVDKTGLSDQFGIESDSATADEGDPVATSDAASGDAISPSDGGVPPFPDASACDASLVHDGHRYVRCEVNTSYYEARQFCLRLGHGYHIVSIGSREENAALDTLMRGEANTYVGLTTQNPEGGIYTWEDGTVSTYRNWRNPDASVDRYTKCVEFERDGYWYRHRCDYDIRMTACEAP